MTNGIPAEHLSADERLGEIAEILAAGVMRLRVPKSSPISADMSENSLDCAGHPSGLDKPMSRRGVVA